MRKILKSGKLFIAGILLCYFNLSKAQVDEEDPYDALALQKKALIGTWMNTGYNTDEIGDHNWTMKFTKEGKSYWYYPGDEVEVYTYTITNYINNNDIRSYALRIINVDGSGEHYGYEIYIGRDQSNNFDEMSLHSGIDDPLMQPGNFVFKKISESTSSKTPSKEEGSLSKEKPKEEEKEPESSPRWELKSSDYDKGYFDGGSAYEQCKKEQGKEREFLDGDRQTPMEKMGWGSKAPRLGLGDCREEAFERIKLRSNEYRRGFEEGWKDASMPANKDKKHKTKVYNN